MTIDEEYMLLGKSLFAAQKIEFALYGIAAHLKNEEKQKLKDKRFKSLNPEVFLRGDVKDLKITLGQLKDALGDLFYLSSDELDKFVDDRNLIAHNYWRLTRSNIRDAKDKLDDPCAFLNDFITQCDFWKKVLNGLLHVMMENVATQNNIVLPLSDENKSDMNFYRSHAGKNLEAQNNCQLGE